MAYVGQTSVHQEAFLNRSGFHPPTVERPRVPHLSWTPAIPWERKVSILNED